MPGPAGDDPRPLRRARHRRRRLSHARPHQVGPSTTHTTLPSTRGSLRRTPPLPKPFLRHTPPFPPACLNLACPPPGLPQVRSRVLAFGRLRLPRGASRALACALACALAPAGTGGSSRGATAPRGSAATGRPFTSAPPALWTPSSTCLSPRSPAGAGTRRPSGEPSGLSIACGAWYSADFGCEPGERGEREREREKGGGGLGRQGEMCRVPEAEHARVRWGRPSLVCGMVEWLM